MKPTLSNRSNLQQRIIAAVVGGGLIVVCTLLNQWTYLAVFFTIGALLQAEFLSIFLKAHRLTSAYFYTVSAAMYSITFIIESNLLTNRFYILLFPVLLFFFVLELYHRKPEPFHRIAAAVLGLIYTSLPFALLHVLAFDRTGNYRYEPILGILLLLWASDTGAYFAGKSFGKHKLFISVSPGKTWEGAIGGVIFTMLAAWFLSVPFPALSTNQWLALGGVAALAGPYGDLVESLLKRSINLKDSGSLIPGHGGFLDRFDSFLFAVPFAAAVLELWPE